MPCALYWSLTGGRTDLEKNEKRVLRLLLNIKQTSKRSHPVLFSFAIIKLIINNLITELLKRDGILYTIVYLQFYSNYLSI